MAEQEVAEEYRTALEDLKSNSKPHITMLTMLADENKTCASAITQVLISHITATPVKLPAMYLIDSIVKNVGDDYKKTFAPSIATVFASVFKDVDEKTRKKLYELRQTWGEVFPKSRLYFLDCTVREYDPAWPMTSQPTIGQGSNIHVNPNKFRPTPAGSLKMPPSSSFVSPVPSGNPKDIEELEKLQNKKRHLAEQRKKIEEIITTNEDKVILDPKHPAPDPKTLAPLSRRADFLQKYKIKKKSPLENITEDTSDKVSSNIYVAPWVAQKIMPTITDHSRISNSSAGSLSHRGGQSMQKSVPKPTRDPRLVTEDPAAKLHSSQFVSALKDSRTQGQATSFSEHRIIKESLMGPGNKTGVSSTSDIKVDSRSKLPKKITAPKAIEKKDEKNEKRNKNEEKNYVEERSRKEKEDRSRKEREDRSRKEREDRSRKEKEDRSRREKEDKSRKEKEDRNRKEKEERSHKEKDNRKEREEKIGKDKEEKNRKGVNLEQIAKVTRSEKEEHIPTNDIGDYLRSGNEMRNLVGKVESACKDNEISPNKKEQDNSAKETEKLKMEKELRERLEKERIEEERLIKEEDLARERAKKDEKTKRQEKLKREDKMKRNEKSKTDDKLKRGDAKTSKEDRMKKNDKSKSTRSIDGGKKADLKDRTVKDEIMQESSGKLNKASKRRRDHIRPRDRSPEEYAKAKDDQDSDDSDHYDANKPLPKVYASKKDPMKGVSTEEQKETDTDLRLLVGRVEGQTNDPSTGKQKNNQITHLFGSSDTDLRPVSFIPQATHSVPLGVVPVNPFETGPDEDLRPPPAVNKDPRLKPMQSEDKKKASFSSPHADKWEKFRARNPEFKDYQRQTSISERLDSEASNAEAYEGEGRRPLRDVDSRYGKFKDPSQETMVEEDPKSEEHYHFMIKQLTDQYSRNEITNTEYTRFIKNIRLRIEQDKIHEVRARDRPPFTPSGASNLKEGWIDRPFGDRSSHDQRFAERGGNTFANWKQGREGRGGMPHYMGPMAPRIDDEFTGESDLPTISDEVLRTVIRENETRKIEIDSTPREIRTYGEKAIILLDWNEPRTLSFEKRVPCDIVFDKGEFTLTMSTGEPYRELKIDHQSHRIKLGVPTQELMIDGKGYQCFYGGKGISVHLSHKDRSIRLDGRPPKVDIGKVKNLDYLVGKIELIINAKKIVPLFLDAKPQRFSIDGVAFVIKFINSFKAVAINGVQFPVEFGGLPISISVRGYRRFLRFSTLPVGIIPGQISVRGMDVDGTTLIPKYPPSPPPASSGTSYKTGPPVLGGLSQTPVMGVPQQPLLVGGTPPSTVIGLPQNPTMGASPQLPGIVVPPQQMMGSQPFVRAPFFNTPPPGNYTRPPPPPGVIPGSYLTTAPQMNVLPPANIPPPNVPSSSTDNSDPAPVIDVQTLLHQLVKTGIIGNKVETPKVKDNNRQKPTEIKPEEEDDEEDIDDLKDLPSVEYMFRIDNLRRPNSKLIKRMYRGMQCSSCGLRYPPEQTAQYSHHLDWHFRMNKKQQESTKKVNTRKFYLCLQDWMRYEELEDTEERVPSMFEMEGEAETKPTDRESEDCEEEIPSVAANSSDPSSGVCPICHETFDQFYNQSIEEWHYKYAIQVEGINYHPTCHLDLIKSQKQEEERIKKEELDKIEKEELEKKEKEELEKKEKVELESKVKKELEKEDLETKEKDELGNKEKEELGNKEKEELGNKEKEELGNKEKEKLGNKEKEELGNKEKEELGNKEKEELGNKEKEELENNVQEKERQEKEDTNSEAKLSVKKEWREETPEKEAGMIVKEEKETENVIVPEPLKLLLVNEPDSPSIPEPMEHVEPPQMPEEDKENTAPNEETVPSFIIDNELYRKVKKNKLNRKQQVYGKDEGNGDPTDISEIKIKEEPVEDIEEGTKLFYPADMPSLLADIPIKIEVPDYDEFDTIIDAFDDDDDDNFTDHEPLRPNNSNIAVTDIATTIDGNTEHSAASQEPTSVPKIKFSVSKPQVNSATTNNNHSEEPPTAASKETASAEEDQSFLDEFSVDFVIPEFSVDLTRKPGFKDVTLVEQPKREGGVEEMSSLCSLM